MKSLLNLSLRRFILCTAVVLLICTPLFYLLTKYYYAEEMIDLIESIKNGAGIPKSDLEEDIMTGMMMQFALIIAVLSLASVITMRLVSKRLWIPFEDTLRKAEKFEVEANTLPVFMATETKEFQELNTTLTRLMRRSATRYREQKEFTENASHELQTPIAILHSKLDILLQEELNERQLELVQELYNVSNRMSRLNRTLLLLAKIDNRQYEARKAVDLIALATNNATQLCELYGHQNKVWISGDPCTTVANPELAEIMVNNLLVNAFRHTPEDGEIVIQGNRDVFMVINTAEGEALDGERIFNRFNHTQDIHRGTGLGLAIVKTICDYHGWEIQYSYENGRHHFTVMKISGYGTNFGSTNSVCGQNLTEIKTETVETASEKRN